MFNPDGRAEQVTDKQLDEGMAVWVRSVYDPFLWLLLVVLADA
jgi:hypothetical protein